MFSARMSLNFNDVLSGGLGYAKSVANGESVSLGKGARPMAVPVSSLPMWQQVLEGGVGSLPSRASPTDSFTLKRSNPAKEEVAAKRVKSYGAIAANREMQGDGFLESSTLKQSTRDLYWQEYEFFIQWCTVAKVPANTVAQMDKAMAKYGNHLFFTGEGIDCLIRCLYGLNHFKTKLAKPLTHFPEASQATKGWRKREPGASRAGCPFEIACLLGTDMVKRGHPKLGAGIVVHHDTYCRPSEMLGVKKKDVLPPMRARRGAPDAWVIQVRPLSDAVPTKTGEYDDTVLIDGKSSTCTSRLLTRTPSSSLTLWLSTLKSWRLVSRPSLWAS